MQEINIIVHWPGSGAHEEIMTGMSEDIVFVHGGKYAKKEWCELPLIQESISDVFKSDSQTVSWTHCTSDDVLDLDALMHAEDFGTGEEIPPEYCDCNDDADESYPGRVAALAVLTLVLLAAFIIYIYSH